MYISGSLSVAVDLVRSVEQNQKMEVQEHDDSLSMSQLSLCTPEPTKEIVTLTDGNSHII